MDSANPLLFVPARDESEAMDVRCLIFGRPN